MKDILKLEGWSITEEIMPKRKGTYVIIQRVSNGIPNAIVWTMPKDFNQFEKFNFFKDVYAYKHIMDSDLYDDVLFKNFGTLSKHPEFNPFKWD